MIELFKYSVRRFEGKYEREVTAKQIIRNIYQRVNHPISVAPGCPLLILDSIRMQCIQKLCSGHWSSLQIPLLASVVLPNWAAYAQTLVSPCLYPCWFSLSFQDAASMPCSLLLLPVNKFFGVSLFQDRASVPGSLPSEGSMAFARGSIGVAAAAAVLMGRKVVGRAANFTFAGRAWILNGLLMEVS